MPFWQPLQSVSPAAKRMPKFSLPKTAALPVNARSTLVNPLQYIHMIKLMVFYYVVLI